MTTQMSSSEPDRENGFEYRDLVDHAPEAIVVLDVDAFRFVEVNQYACTFFGYTHAQLMRMGPGDVSPPVTSDGRSSGEAVRSHIERALQGERPVFEWVHQAKSGRTIPTEVRLIRLPVPGRRLVRGSITDISHRLAMDRALRESEEQFRRLADASPTVVWQADAEGNGIYLNEQWTVLTGHSVESALGGGWGEATHPEDREAVYRSWQRSVASGERWRQEYRIVHTNQEVKCVIGVAVPVRREGDNAIWGWVGSVTDVTDLKRAEAARRALEKKMMEAQKLESLGLLAGGIAHDFNNLLFAILGNASLVLAQLPPDSPHRESLEAIDRTAGRAAELCQQLLAYSGRGRFSIARIDLNELVKEMLKIVRMSLSHKAILDYRLADPLPAVEADASQLRQVVVNLMTNASEALSGASGSIHVETSAIECTAEDLQEAFLGDQCTPGLYVCLRVSDSGRGIDPADLPLIFDPFYTTKFTGHGLGLAAVLGILKGHRGAIKVSSLPGEGTVMRVLLPATKGAPEPQALWSADLKGWRGSGDVLLVDDDPEVLQVGRRLLEHFGFTVRTADRGQAAIDLVKKVASLRLLLLDLTMPEMDGEECLRLVRSIRPNLPVVISSGYSSHEVAERFEALSPEGFLQKPYRARTLEAMLRRVLEEI